MQVTDKMVEAVNALKTDLVNESALRAEARTKRDATLTAIHAYAEGTLKVHLTNFTAALATVNAEAVGGSTEIVKGLRFAASNMSNRLQQIDAIDKAIAYLSAPQASVPEGYALVPVEPSRGRLISMAIRHNHAFLVNHDPNAKWTSGVTKEHRESVLRSMRQLYEEL